MEKINDQVRFNIFSFLSTFARALVEIYISLYMFNNGYSINQIVLFYVLINLFSIPLSYIFTKLGEETKYIYIMLLGFVGFFSVQIMLRSIKVSTLFLVLISLVYAVYKRGYWVARKYYITNIMPSKKSSSKFSIILVMSQIASILAGFLGAVLFSGLNITILMIISSLLLFISIIPLARIKCESKPKEIKLIENFKKYNKRNLIVFSMFEISNILSVIFPIYIAISYSNTYSITGKLNAISNVAIIAFVLIYGKLINDKKNYMVVSTILVLVCYLFKLETTGYILMAVCFIEGIIDKMQNQSINKIYFENRENMDLTHYCLIYQIIECVSRVIMAIPLLFVNNIKVMILYTIIVMFILMLLYIIKKEEK